MSIHHSFILFRRKWQNINRTMLLVNKGKQAALVYAASKGWKESLLIR
jgi:hypothetical protein